MSKDIKSQERKFIRIELKNAQKAYSCASKEQKTLLDNLFGKDVLKKSCGVCERVKTFSDALIELGESHPLVEEYHAVADVLEGVTTRKHSADILAYLKLRIICAALNEGWEPKFTNDEYRYYPWLYLISKDEYNRLTDEEKSRAVLRSYNNANAYGGLVYAGANYASSCSNTSYGSRLALKTRELAKYAGAQFLELCADYCFKAE